MTPGPRLAAALAASALAAPLTGCGGSGSGTLSRAEFTSRANTICKRVNDQIGAVGQAKSAADVERIGPGVIASEQRGLADLRRLQPPAALRRDWQRLLSDLTTLSADAAKLIDAAKRADNAAAQQIASAGQQVQADVTSTAQRLGLTECAKG